MDSTKAGNPARFINHAPHRKANLEVSSASSHHLLPYRLIADHVYYVVMLVHGEQRIGIYASESSEMPTSDLLRHTRCSSRCMQGRTSWPERSYSWTMGPTSPFSTGGAGSLHVQCGWIPCSFGCRYMRIGYMLDGER